jgi:putative exporter of polyketide antibiotics
VAVLPLVVTVLLIALAYALQERRDFGSGLLPSRPGPAEAAPALRSPWALAWRLQRANLLGWVIGYAIVGTVLGAVAGSVASLAGGESMQELLRKLGGNASSLTDTFISTELQFLAIGAAAYGISAALRLRSEENDLHTEQILATSTRRWTVLASHSVIALLGSALLMLVLALALALGTRSQYGGFGAALGHLLPSALADDPAGVGMRRAGACHLRLGAQDRLRRLGAAGGLRRGRRVRPVVQPAAAGDRRVAVRPRRRAARVERRCHATRRPLRHRRSAGGPWRRRHFRRRDIPS